jgi:hypothetical protein
MHHVHELILLLVSIPTYLEGIPISVLVSNPPAANAVTAAILGRNPSDDYV